MSELYLVIQQLYAHGTNEMSLMHYSHDYEVLTVLTIKLTVFWNVTSVRTDISEDTPASIIKVTVSLQ
jgi:hypothetical protein